MSPRTGRVTPRRIHLVRHGRSAVDRSSPPHAWALDPAGRSAIAELRASGRLPDDARWFSSPETKALETARMLTDGEVTVVPELREHERHSTVWFDDPQEFRAVVRRAFEDPDQPALEGWEPLACTRDRLVPVVRRILADHPDEEVVLAGHGTAWTLLVAELTGRPPDLEAWARLRMPDLWVVDTV
ncbi:MAG TPA: histidine phosphatase family protein [Nocardioidaceae bacterium]